MHRLTSKLPRLPVTAPFLQTASSTVLADLHSVSARHSRISILSKSVLEPTNTVHNLECFLLAPKLELFNPSVSKAKTNQKKHWEGRTLRDMTDGEISGLFSEMP